MLELFKAKEPLRFMKFSRSAMVLSILLVGASLVTLGINKLNWGLDFTGGTVIEVAFEQVANLPKVRNVLEKSHYFGAIVQYFGNSRSVMVRVPPIKGLKGEVLGAQIVHTLQAANIGKLSMRRVEFVGPNVGKELAIDGGLAIVISLFCIMLYVSIRFEWRLALGAVLALAHDVIITLGVFSFFHLEFDLTVLAAVLAVIGYSLNDTIVVFDRIRENFRRMSNSTTVGIVDMSLTQTLTRTTITSGLTSFVLIALFVVGGPVIHGFSTALLIGIFVGTYSSIYVASALAVRFGLSREDMIPKVVEKEGADQESLM
ncbi:MAG: protein translocase subunit SecF [Psychromonas sp.]|nr:protein translocase subunit SecF [Psychromonas sp.]